MTNLWWKMFVENRNDMYGLDSAILMNRKVWEASGHTGAGFADPLVEDLVTRKRFRADHLLEENDVEDIVPTQTLLALSPIHPFFVRIPTSILTTSPSRSIRFPPMP